MKRLILPLVILFTSIISLNAQNVGVNWEKGSLNEVIAKAQKNKKGPKLIFLDCYTSWCGPCKYMANTIFPTKEAGDYFNTNFLNVKFDMEKGEGIEIKKKYDIAAYPTFLVLDENGKEIGRIVGGGELEPFIKKVERAKDLKNSPEWLANEFNNSKTASNAIAYTKSLVDSYQHEKAGEFLSENISLIGKEFAFNNDNWQVIKSVATAIGPDVAPIQRFIEKNKAFGAEKVGNDAIVATLLKSYGRTLFGYQRNGKSNVTITKEDALKAAQNLQLLSTSTKSGDYVLAQVFDLYLNGRMDEIVEMYNFNNYKYYNSNDWQIIESAFRFVKEIPQEKRDAYKADKKTYIEKYILRN